MGSVNNSDVKVGEQVAEESGSSLTRNLMLHQMNIMQIKIEKARKLEVKKQIMVQKKSAGRKAARRKLYRKRSRAVNRLRKEKWMQIIADVSSRNDLSDLHKMMLEKSTTPPQANWVPFKLKKKFINFIVATCGFKPKHAKEAGHLFDILKAEEGGRNTCRKPHNNTEGKDVVSIEKTEVIKPKHAKEAGHLFDILKTEEGGRNTCRKPHNNTEGKDVVSIEKTEVIKPKHAKEAGHLFDILKAEEGGRNTCRNPHNDTVGKDVVIIEKTELIEKKIPLITIEDEPGTDEEEESPMEEKEEKPKLDANVPRSRGLEAMDIFKRYLLQQRDIDEATWSHVAALESYISRS